MMFFTKTKKVVEPSQIMEAFERLKKGDVKYRFTIDMKLIKGQ